VLPETVHLDTRQYAHRVGARPCRDGEKPRQRVGTVCDVGVTEQNPVASSPARTLLERPGLPEPSFRKLFAIDDGDTRIAARSLDRGGARPIGRSVVDDDRFENRIVRLEEAAKRRANRLRFIPRGNDDGNANAGRRAVRRDPRYEREIQELVQK